MRIAIVSDIHANRTAFEAVLLDLTQTAPDLVLHGGDLVHGGVNPAEIVDRVRDLGWLGVLGNTDEMLFRPESLQEFSRQSTAPRPLFDAIERMAAWDREALGEDRLAWLKCLPLRLAHGEMALVHASPENCWHAPAAEAGDHELESVFSPLGQPVAIYAHIHRPFVRKIGGRMNGKATVANTGSVGVSYDSDPRASYLLLDDFVPQIRRVAYDLESELKNLADCDMPHADWIARMLRSASPQMP